MKKGGRAEEDKRVVRAGRKRVETRRSTETDRVSFCGKKQGKE